MSSSLRLCKDCRHFLNDSPVPVAAPAMYMSAGRCRLARFVDQTQTSVVPEVPTDFYVHTHTHTQRGPSGACGIEGRLFELETNLARRMWNQHAGALTTSIVIIVYILQLATMCLIVLTLRN